MIKKFWILLVIICINSSHSFAWNQIFQEEYKSKIDAYIEMHTYNPDKLKKTHKTLTKLEQKLQKQDIQFDSRIQDLQVIVAYFTENINEYFLEKEKHGYHIKTPKNIKALYYSAYSASRDDKIEHIISLAQTSEINSLMIDIKEIDGYTSFAFSDENFSNIIPESNHRISDIQELISRLHENNIYVIWRIVVFKDNYLPSKMPELAIKWSNNTSEVWGDYKDNSYSDPYSKKVWDYHIELASESYQLWFDEINFDYVRFPTDWYISQTYYPFAWEILDKNPTWWKMQVMEEFAWYIASTLKEKHPDIILSADIFWLATHTDIFQIGQNIETFAAYFDYVAPMIYPSHYGKWYLGFQVPDNHPYEIFDDSIKKSISRINNFNIDLKTAKLENRTVMFPWDISATQQNIKNIDISKIRPWLQAFHCTWCDGATTYDRDKFRQQIQALEDNGIYSWYAWNASGRYENNWFD